MITVAALVISILSVAVCLVTLHQLRTGWKSVRERENLADAFEKVLRNREAGLRQREKAVWWAEQVPVPVQQRSPRWVQR